MKGDVAKTEGGHDGHGPIDAGDPAEVTPFINHQHVEQRRVEANNKKKRGEKLPQHGKISLYLSMAKEKNKLAC